MGTKGLLSVYRSQIKTDEQGHERTDDLQRQTQTGKDAQAN